MIMQSFKGTGMAWVKNYIDQFRGGVKGVHENLINQL